jgi:hypothetical protein
MYRDLEHYEEGQYGTESLKYANKETQKEHDEESRKFAERMKRKRELLEQEESKKDK